MYDHWYLSVANFTLHKFLYAIAGNQTPPCSQSKESSVITNGSLDSADCSLLNRLCWEKGYENSVLISKTILFGMESILWTQATVLRTDVQHCAQCSWTHCKHRAVNNNTMKVTNSLWLLVLSPTVGNRKSPDCSTVVANDQTRMISDSIEIHKSP